MSFRPPAKKLKQSTLFDSWKRKGNPVKVPAKPTCQRASLTDVADTQGLSMDRVSHDAVGGQKETDTKDDASLPCDEATKEQRQVSRNEAAGSSDNYSRARDDKPKMSSLHYHHRAPVSPSEPGDMDEPCRHKTPFEPISLGTSKQCLNTSLPCSSALPPLRTSHDHTVLCQCYESSGKMASSSSNQEDPRLWHPDYVKMPFSQKAECIVTVHDKNWSGKEQKRKVLKWMVICESLTKPMFDFNDLKEAILSYNERYTESWNFGGLQFFLNHHMDDGERTEFFDIVLPRMAKLALDLPSLCSQPIPILMKGTARSVTMSQEQAACLLANAFLCTFPGCNTYQKRPNFKGMNFNRLYRRDISQMKVGKLKCLLHYFKTVTENMPQGNVTYSRRVLKSHDCPRWETCQNALPRLHVTSGGTIEDDGYGMLQVDFANKYIGGGVLGEGCVQEEIRFVICPELIVSILLTEVLDHNEAVVITGCQRFSCYTGYASSFEWSGSYEDPTPRDDWGRRCTDVVAIDATHVRRQSEEFEACQVCRELNKAYAGFHDPHAGHTRSAVATGNWGCGAFGGDVRLKVLIQLMAAAVAEREVCYFTYKDNALTRDIYNIHKLMTDKHITVGDVRDLISDYGAKVSIGAHVRRGASGPSTHDHTGHHRTATSPDSDRRKNVFEFIREQLKSTYSGADCQRTTTSSEDRCNVKASGKLESDRREGDGGDDRSGCDDGEEGIRDRSGYSDDQRDSDDDRRESDDSKDSDDKWKRNFGSGDKLKRNFSPDAAV